DSTFPHGLQSCGNEVAGRSEDECGVEGFGRQVFGVISPNSAEAAGELLCFRVAGTCKGKDFATFEPGYLYGDVGGGAESIESDASGVAGFAQSAIADEAGAEERCRCDVVEPAGEVEAESSVNDGEFRVTSVDGVTGELSVIAEILSS